jgi:inner membrane protein
MITVSGVPLLFPFFKNPCVIPGNVNYRFKGGDFKSEFVVCAVCGILCFTMQPLFAQGFWNTYNRQFGTIKHVDRENQNTSFYVVCDYDYVLNSQNFIGEVIVIESKQNELILFDNLRVFTLHSDNPMLNKTARLKHRKTF